MTTLNEDCLLDFLMNGNPFPSPANSKPSQSRAHKKSAPFMLGSMSMNGATDPTQMR